MLADWILSAAPGFDEKEGGNHEFQASPPRMTAVSANAFADTCGEIVLRDCHFELGGVRYDVAALLSNTTRCGSSAAGLWPPLTTAID